MPGENAKYITYTSAWGYATAIIFSGNHAEMAAMLHLNKKDILGAGNITADFRCYGRSVTLNIKSAEDADTQIVKRMMNMED